MKAPETKWLLIFNPYGEGNRIERFITKDELEAYINSNELGSDPEIYEVKAYKVKLQISIVDEVTKKEGV
jgi:hypothetical protein